ncbi:hypothetical protein CDAR_244101 [Caerostris darwini]|uniref:Uncharacterized protein n=1 Tax=Caerostris darwini TaxID=1538125 RepID=A0AAV4RGI3_9ARAC|nr:hypothetical protein CDAR_244101 [Caerostris darwini]
MKTSALFMILVLVSCAVLVAESAPIDPLAEGPSRSGRTQRSITSFLGNAVEIIIDIILLFVPIIVQLTVNKYQMNPSRLLTMCILAGVLIMYSCAADDGGGGGSDNSDQSSGDSIIRNFTKNVVFKMIDFFVDAAASIF